jgi:hypothetical protein
VRVGAALLEHVRASGLSSVAIVGIAKNVGKTVTMRALYEAAYEQGVRTGLVSAGRDGEAFDAVFENPKPRLWLYPGTWIATLRQMGGPLEYARVTAERYYELIGPPTASGVRSAVDALSRRCDLVVIDGAIDRLAVIATGRDAVVVASGAAAAAREEEAIEDTSALVARLRIPPLDEGEPALYVAGALLPDAAERLIAKRERRQVVVKSPAAFQLAGKLAARALAQLRVRCERSVTVVAATVASIGPTHEFEPREFLEAIAGATSLPTYDVYAGAAAGPAISPASKKAGIELHPGRARLAAALGRDAIESGEFIVMRDALRGSLPSGVRIVREAPTYLLCEVA